MGSLDRIRALTEQELRPDSLPPALMPKKAPVFIPAARESVSPRKAGPTTPILDSVDEFARSVLPESARAKFRRENPDLVTKFLDNPLEYAGEALTGENDVPRADLGDLPRRFALNAASIPLSMMKPAARVARELPIALGFGIPGLEATPTRERALDAVRQIGDVGIEFGKGLLEQARGFVEDPIGALAERPADTIALGHMMKGGLKKTAETARLAAVKVPAVEGALKKAALSTPVAALGFPQEGMKFGEQHAPRISEAPISRATKAGDEAVLAMGQDVPEAPLPPAAAAEAAGQSNMFAPPKLELVPKPAASSPPEAPSAKPATPEQGAAVAASVGKPSKVSQTTVKSGDLSFYDEFQNRGDVKQGGSLFSEEKLQGFLRDAGGFDMDLITRDPVTVWRDVKNELGAGKGRTYALDGHHRGELAKWNWEEQKPGVWTRAGAVSRDMPAVEFKGSLAEAVEASKDLNRKGVPNTYSENAVRAREMLKGGDDVRKVADRLRVSTGKVKDLEDFAHLDDSLRPEISKSERAIPYGVALGRMARRYPEHFGKESQLKYWKMIEEGRGKAGGVRSVSELESVLEMEASAIEAAKQSNMFGDGGIAMSADLTKKALELVRAINGEATPEKIHLKGFKKQFAGKPESEWSASAKRVMKDARARTKVVAKLQKEFGPEGLRSELVQAMKAGEPVEQTMDAILKRIRERIAAPTGKKLAGPAHVAEDLKSRKPTMAELTARGAPEGVTPAVLLTDDIHPNPAFQHRKDVAGATQANEAKVAAIGKKSGGKIDPDKPLLVWEDAKGEIGPVGTYYVADGNHRLNAARSRWDAQGNKLEAVNREVSVGILKGSHADMVEFTKTINTRANVSWLAENDYAGSPTGTPAKPDFSDQIKAQGRRLHAAAVAAREGFLADLNTAAAGTGKVWEEGAKKYAVKSEAGVVEKLAHGRNATDTLRATVISSSPKTSLAPFVAGMESLGYKIWQGDVTDRFEMPGTYKDIAIKFDKGDGLVREVQIMGPHMLEAKNFVGHSVYEIERALARAKRAGVAFEESDEVSRILKEEISDPTYSAAFELDSAAESSAPRALTASPTVQSASNARLVNGMPNLSNSSRTALRGLLKQTKDPASARAAFSKDISKALTDILDRLPEESVPKTPAIPKGKALAPPKPPRPPKATAGPPGSQPPPKPPTIPPVKTSLVARGLNKVAGGLEALDRATDPGRAIAAAFTTARVLSPAVNDLGARVGEHLIRRGEQLEARRIYGKGQSEFFRKRDREAAEIVRETRHLSKPEKRNFYRFVTGLEGLSADASPAMRKAFDWWKTKNEQEQRRLIDLGLLDPTVSSRRAYQPLRMEKWGPESEANLQKLRREAEQKGIMDSRAHRVLDGRTAKLERDLISRGKEAPLYFPMLRSVRPSDFLPSRMLKHERHSQMKLSSGKLLESGAFERDPAQAMAKVVNQRLKLESAEKTIAEIMDSPKIPKRIYKKGEILKDSEALFAPDGFLKFYRRTVDFSDEIAKVADRVGSVDEALAEYLHRSIAAGDFTDTSLGVAQAKVYVMPKKVVEELRAQITPVPRWVRLFYDRPIDYWRTAVLPLRPAWLVNNLVGDAVFATLAGVSPRHYAMAVREKYRAAMPDEIRQSGMGKEATQIHLGRSADTMIGKAVTFIEQAPGPRHLGALADRMSAANSATDTFFRQATYIRQAEKIARAKRVKRVLEGFNDSYELLRAMDSLTPGEAAAAMKRVNHFMGDYIGGLTPWERQWVRRIVPFYAFMKHQTRLLMTLPSEAPGKFLMMSQLAQVGEDIDAESEKKLPVYLRNKGLIDLRADWDVDFAGQKRHVRVYLASQGWNPLILGFSPSGEVRGLSGDPRELVSAATSQTNPLVQYGVSALTQKNTLGRPFTEPGTFEERGRFYRANGDLTGYPKDRIVGGAPGSPFTEVKPPAPNLAESYLGAFPQVNLARKLVRPEAGYTAEPFSVESSAGARVGLARTRLTEALRYFTGGSIMLVDTESGQAMPVSRSTIRSLLRKQAQERSRKH